MIAETLLYPLWLSLSPQEAGFTGFMRSLRGRDQEKVGKRKEELWGRHAGRGGGRCTAQFVIALWPLTLARALSALMWETWWPQRKAIFLHHGDHVCNNANREPTQLDRPLETSFSWMFWWAEKTKKWFCFVGFFFIIIFLWILFFFLFLCPNTVTAYVRSYTLYCIYAILTPAYPCGGLCDWLTPVVVGGGGHHWFKVEAALSITPQGPNQVPINPALSDPVFLYRTFMSPVQNHPEYCVVILTDQLDD